MLKKLPQGISPRFSCEEKNFTLIDAAIESVGHVIIEDVFTVKSLLHPQQHIHTLFQKRDQFYQKQEKNFTPVELDIYFGNTFSFEDQTSLSQFIATIQSSPLLDLLFYLLKGDIAAGYGPVLRRNDIQHPLQHIGHHCDAGLISEYVNNAFNSNKQYTMWTPLCDVDESTGGLLMFSKNRSRQYASAVHNPTSPYTDIMGKISKVALHHPPNEPVTAQALTEREHYYNAFDIIIDELGDELYAPILNMGSVILFDQHVLHGPFFHHNLTKPRYSIDLRFFGDFDKSKDYELQMESYIFKKYTMDTFFPGRKNTELAFVREEIDALRNALLQHQYAIDQLKAKSPITKTFISLKQRLSIEFKNKIKRIVKST